MRRLAQGLVIAAALLTSSGCQTRQQYEAAYNEGRNAAAEEAEELKARLSKLEKHSSDRLYAIRRAGWHYCFRPDAPKAIELRVMSLDRQTAFIYNCESMEFEVCESSPNYFGRKCHVVDPYRDHPS